MLHIAAAGPRAPREGRYVMGVDVWREVGAGAGLVRAPKPPDLWDVMQVQVDRAFADVLGGQYLARDDAEPGGGPRGSAR
jgi:hypothetical protein